VVNRYTDIGKRPFGQAMVAESLLTASEKRITFNGKQPIVVAGTPMWEIPGYA
jgi:hypothetical protein